MRVKNRNEVLLTVYHVKRIMTSYRRKAGTFEHMVYILDDRNKTKLIQNLSIFSFVFISFVVVKLLTLNYISLTAELLGPIRTNIIVTCTQIHNVLISKASKNKCGADSDSKPPTYKNQKY